MSIDNEIQIWKLTPLDKVLSVSKVNLEQPAISLDEVSKFLPGGAYTTLRTFFHTKVMHIEEHFLRLEESALRVNAEIQPQVTYLRPALKQILQESPHSESRVRITLDLENEPGCFYVTLEKLRTPPDKAYLEGVRVISRRMQRDNPKAKLTKFIITASQYRAQLPQGVNELLMVDQNGIILEGLSSNFFGISGGTILTVEEGVLLGITRGAVLEIAGKYNIPVSSKGIRIDQLQSLEECFITSASRGVLPVVQIDKIIIGSGKPGILSLQLIRLFNQWLEKNIEEI